MTAPTRSPRDGEDQTTASRRIVQLLLGVSLVAVAFAAPARPSSHVDASFGGGEDPCVAQVAGLVETEVLWFDGVPFFQRQNFTGNTHLYLTEAGAPDPTDHAGPTAIRSALADLGKDDVRNVTDLNLKSPVLVRSGEYYNFTDANGVTWNVTEAYVDVGPTHDEDDSGPDTGSEPSVTTKLSAHAGLKRYYVWIVELGEKRDDQNIGVPPTIGDGGEYNFATRANTTKFTNETQQESITVEHTNDTSTQGSDLCHPDHNHTHEKYDAHLWLGRQPDVVPLDCEPAYAVSGALVARYDFAGPEALGIEGDLDGGTCSGAGSQGGDLL